MYFRGLDATHIKGEWFGIREKKKERKRPFFLLPKNHDMRRAYAYLLKTRLLDREVVEYFMHTRLIYEDAKCHNVVFVEIDEAGIACHAHKRGMCFQSAYKGNEGSVDSYYSAAVLDKRRKE